MKIKNVLKSVGITSAVIGAVAGINKCIFKLTEKKNENYITGSFYDWQYGNIYYEKKGHGKPIVLVHSIAIGASHREFERNIDELSKKYTVYAIDLPGFGYSDKPKITYTAFIYASFINDFIMNVVKSHAAVVASNGSGMFAVIAAKLFPHNISKLFLVSPGGIDGKMAENSDFLKRTTLELPLYGTTVYNIMSSKKNIKSFLINEGFFAPHNVTDDIIESFYLAAHGTNGNARYAYASMTTNYMNMDIKSYFNTLLQPVYVVWGEENNINPIKNMDVLEAMKPEAEFFIFEQTRLFPHIENPSEFNKIIKEKI